MIDTGSIKTGQRKDAGMNVEITNVTKNENAKYVEMTCGKISALVCFHTFSNGKELISVVCKNASHKVWGGIGKQYRNIFEAVNGYKSESMKAMIRAAVTA
jgi:DNA-binding protein H-NS